MTVNFNDNFFTPQLAGIARQLGCPKIVLDHVSVLYLYICDLSREKGPYAEIINFEKTGVFCNFAKKLSIFNFMYICNA